MHLLVEHAVTEEQIRETLAAHSIIEADVRPIAPSLEDVFVALTANANEQNNGRRKEAMHV
jgi:hypothetical protein